LGEDCLDVSKEVRRAGSSGDPGRLLQPMHAATPLKADTHGFTDMLAGLANRFFNSRRVAIKSIQEFGRSFRLGIDCGIHRMSFFNYCRHPTRNDTPRKQSPRRRVDITTSIESITINSGNHLYIVLLLGASVQPRNLPVLLRYDRFIQLIPKPIMSTPPFNVLTATASELRDRLKAGTLTSVKIISTYLDQIEKHNHVGVKLNAMITVAPRELVLKAAEKLDSERGTGKVRGPLHGLPVIVKVG
jgi:hypothetical protein